MRAPCLMTSARKDLTREASNRGRDAIEAAAHNILAIPLLRQVSNFLCMHGYATLCDFTYLLLRNLSSPF